MAKVPVITAAAAAEEVYESTLVRCQVLVSSMRVAAAAEEAFEVEAAEGG